MISWVHELALEWGAYMRSLGNPYNSENILHRMMTEGIGASHAYVAAIPELRKEVSEPEVLSFHRAFLRLPELHRDVVYVFYVPVAKIGTRLKVLEKLHGLSQTRAYELRSLAHAQIWGYIDAHLQVVSVKSL